MQYNEGCFVQLWTNFKKTLRKFISLVVDEIQRRRYILTRVGLYRRADARVSLPFLRQGYKVGRFAFIFHSLSCFYSSSHDVKVYFATFSPSYSWIQLFKHTFSSYPYMSKQHNVFSNFTFPEDSHELIVKSISINY